MSYIEKKSSALARLSTSQDVANGTIVPILFDTKIYDTDGMIDIGANPGRITIKKYGGYLVTAEVLWPSNTTGYRWAFVEHYNSSDVRYRYVSDNRGTVATGNETAQCVVGNFLCVPGDYFVFSLLHNAGTTLQVSVPSMGVIKVK